MSGEIPPLSMDPQEVQTRLWKIHVGDYRRRKADCADSDGREEVWETHEQPRESVVALFGCRAK